MIGLFKKKRLHKKVIVLNAIPYKEVEFKRLCTFDTSDFIKSLTTEKCKLPSELWKRFEKTAKQIESTFSKLSKWGVVIQDFYLCDLGQVTDYDVVIILAHHSDNSDEIELEGKLISTQKFTDAFPQNMKGVVDLTSCYSSYLIPKLKLKNPHCKFIGIDVATTIPFRLFLLEEVINSMRTNRELEYKEALISSLRIIRNALSTDDYESHISDSENIHLGGEKLKSTVFAPASIAKGQDFLVQVFLHHEKDTDEVLLTAQMIDEDTSMRNSKNLNFRLQDGDKIEFQLIQLPKSSEDFEFEEEIKGFTYDGSPSSVEFCVSVLPSCKKAAFIGKIKIAVNKQPIGDVLFKTAIVSTYNLDNQNCAKFSFNRYDMAQASEDANTWLIKKIDSVKQQILANSKHSEISKVELEICEKCIELLTSNDNRSNAVLRVFISSTSDMKKYRLVIKEQVASCEMYADMYELWGQGNDYPRDMCCKHVIDSDIFVLILGSNYGFVEPYWGLSMTEIEYRVAERCGIPILIYIDSNWRKNINNRDEYSDTIKRQESLITELSSNRLVHFFQNENKLALQSIAELLTLKNRMIYGSTSR